MPIHFEKFQGNGNDFILIDDWNHQFPDENAELIKSLCTRKFGIGADGLILLRSDRQVDYKMVYFNADGNEGSLCGNGGRCMALFAKQKGYAGGEQLFSAIDGYHKAKIGESTIALSMQSVSEVNKYNDNELVINTGSPHYVYFVEDTKHFDVENKGRSIRDSEQFKKQGINVNFVSQDQDKCLNVRTYERGVEAETLSCGTGVVASAIAYHVLNLNGNAGTNKRQLKIDTLGGPLWVYFQEKGNNHFEHIWLEGPVSRIFQGSTQEFN